MSRSNQDAVQYWFEIVGGPWDGVQGLTWVDDGEPEHQVPERIWIGRCRGDGACGQSWCGHGRVRRVHPAFWTAVEAVPMRTVEYEKEIDFVRRGDPERGVFEGVARYSMGGIGLPSAVEIEERVPAGATA